MDLAREWNAFGGVLITLMGVNLFATADRRAEDAVSLDRRRREAPPAAEPALEDKPLWLQIRRMNRVAGTAFAAIGAGFLLATAAGIVAGYPKKPGGELVAGVFMTGIGAAIAYRAWRRNVREARWLLGAAPRLPLGERVGAACVNGMTALFLVYGIRLVRVGLR